MELWKPIKGFEEYEISTEGRVKRVLIGRGTNAKGGLLKPCPSKSKGYLTVYLSKNSKQKSKAVHILVAQTFIPNPLGLPQVNHKDGDKNNCKVDNLEWRTQVGNMRHASSLGLHGKGVHFYKGKWRATYNPEPRKRVWLGDFPTEEEALEARKKAIDSLPSIL